jgi:hypothetical protein
MVLLKKFIVFGFSTREGWFLIHCLFLKSISETMFFFFVNFFNQAEIIKNFLIKSCKVNGFTLNILKTQTFSNKK